MCYADQTVPNRSPEHEIGDMLEQRLDTISHYFADILSKGKVSSSRNQSTKGLSLSATCGRLRSVAAMRNNQGRPPLAEMTNDKGVLTAQDIYLEPPK